MSIVLRSVSVLGLLLLFTLVSCNNNQCPICPPVTQDQEQLDAHFDDFEGGGYFIYPTFDSTEDAAQVFITGGNGMLSRIEVLLTQQSGTGNFRFELRRCDSSGIPLEDNNDFLAFVNFEAADLPMGPATPSTTWLSVNLTSFAIPLQSGEFMAIVLQSSGPTISWWAADLNPYKAGAGWRRNVNGGSWGIVNPLVDFMFRVYLDNSNP